ncbi:2-amino-4-hydroxy-6-hydroxymethyldihydropteridine diphosphokinase [Candidatus Bipolaricaulota bacterium]|nr:2-amino-4-hydroxy-6-hydroxymethyldihydropteridine diphosphokinase [Candidatus Bipolaricaulota bacterium]
MAKAFLGLGANLPPEEERLREALRLLSAKGARPVALSSLYRTEPWGRADQPWFVNLVVEVETELPPRALLRVAKGIEQALGRKDRGRWGPREVDIDILLYEDLVVQDPDLTVPHPRLPARRFVLEPLCEIAPQARHPLLGLTMAELLSRVPDERRVVRLKEITF